MNSINPYLRNLSEELFISYNSPERTKINNSFSTIKGRLKSFFGNEIDSVDAFGSYTRGTILPRKYDNNSDVDLIIQFDTEIYPKYTAETYRNKLKRFAEHWYSSSLVYKDFPTVVLELQNIKFDLVPAIQEVSFLDYVTLYIPDRFNNWQTTEPFAFSQKLTKANSAYNNIVKPIVRLLKFWNASASYPFASFELEQLIADMNFSGDNYESGFFYAIKYLPDNHTKVASLKSNAEMVSYYLERGDIERAEKWLYRILPY